VKPGDIVVMTKALWARDNYRSDKLWLGKGDNLWLGKVGRIIKTDGNGLNIEGYFPEDNLPRWVVNASQVEHLTALEAEVLHARQQSPQASRE